MRTIFKRATIVAIVLTMSVAANAQQGEKAIGGNLIFGTGGNHSHVGIGGKFSYNLTDPIRFVGEFDFFPKKDFISWWDVSAYGNYLFLLSDKIDVYPLVGVGMTGAKVDLGKYNFSTNGFVFSLGGGLDYELTSKLLLSIELRYKFINFKDIGVSGNRTHLVVGIAHKF